MSEIVMGVSEFKAKALEVLSSVSDGDEYLLTKRGQPIARVLPFEKQARKTRGSYKDFVEIEGDIVEFDSTDLWEAVNEDTA